MISLATCNAVEMASHRTLYVGMDHSTLHVGVGGLMISLATKINIQESHTGSTKYKVPVCMCTYHNILKYIS